ncbi:unnamed protein product [Paramecium sonneborni]|uniref:Uncharacterized protein n=1 Tax=Paramecium sonneborni TaxID=65129 RepID=A0A8S1N1A0_9CILI|nr:unnamed protein product [Paramecium sonneborni]
MESVSYSTTVFSIIVDYNCKLNSLYKIVNIFILRLQLDESRNKIYLTSFGLYNLLNILPIEVQLNSFLEQQDIVLNGERSFGQIGVNFVFVESQSYFKPVQLLISKLNQHIILFMSPIILQSNPKGLNLRKSFVQDICNFLPELMIDSKFTYSFNEPLV